MSDPEAADQVEFDIPYLKAAFEVARAQADLPTGAASDANRGLHGEGGDSDDEDRGRDDDGRDRGPRPAEGAVGTGTFAPPSPSPLGSAVMRGPAGALVSLIEPHSEADPAALLVQALVMFGSMVGRGPHFLADGSRHGTNIFVCVVGETAKARKGTAWSQVRRALAPIDPDWDRDCVALGLSTGEGLIWAVRDQIVRSEATREDGEVVYEDVVVDGGVEDKRLLVVESEFASVLRMFQRDGSKLSPTIRQAWDSGDLRIMTRTSPARATGAHISMVGHVTRDEVLRYLDRTEIGNGFANRYLWVWAQRSKLLPEGGALRERDLEAVLSDLRAALEFSRQLGDFELKRDDPARALWISVYAKLSAGQPGLLGAVTSRAEAQVMRLACIYALLDRAPVLWVVHLEAALELWRYADESARFIFGTALGDPDADTILAGLRSSPEGLTRSEIGELFARHLSASRLGRALGVLAGAGKVQRTTEETGGRPAERWRAV